MKLSVPIVLGALTLAGCASDEERVQDLAPGVPDAPGVLVRERTPGKTSARFSVESQAIRAGYFVRFEVFAEGHDGRWPRWTCVAYRDVSECFGQEGVRLPYRPEDDRLVLEVDAGPLENLGGRGRRASGPIARAP